MFVSVRAGVRDNYTRTNFLNELVYVCEYVYNDTKTRYQIDVLVSTNSECTKSTIRILMTMHILHCIE